MLPYLPIKSKKQWIAIFWELLFFHFVFLISGPQFLCFSVVLLFRVSLLLCFSLLACFSAFLRFPASLFLLLLCFSAPLIFCFSAFQKKHFQTTSPDPKTTPVSSVSSHGKTMKNPWVSSIFHPRRPRLGFAEASLWAQRMHRRHRIQRLRSGLLRGATGRGRGRARGTAPEALLKLMQAVLLLLHLLS